MIKNKNFFYLSILVVFSLMVFNYNFILNYFYNACFSIILFSSLITFLILFFKGNKIGFKGAYFLIFLSSILQILSFFTIFYNFVKNINNVMYSYNLGNWFWIGNFKVSFNFVFDGLSILMIQLVLFISMVTQIYSFYYLKTDPNIIRFQSYIALFTFFMLILVTADNFIVFFLGWEGVGLCSYLLISFWFTRLEARMAGLKAIGVNKVGDAAFIIAVGMLASLTKSVEFSVIFNCLSYYKNITIDLYFFEVQYIAVINGLFLVAVSAKSAQIGLHIWLADAMEGPTPVSALIHAATMVTAGIYLVIRISLIFELTPAIKIYMAYIGAITAFFGASTAAFQWDIKKIIAYSTCSQLGYMLCACGFGGYKLAFYHLIIHGYFKALLFFAAGLIIHNFNGEQDIRRMGGLLKFFPITFSYFFIGLISLVGLPGTSGFYSKEKILDYISIINSEDAQVCYSFLILALTFTAYYSLKLVIYIFTSAPRGPKPYYTIIAIKNFKEAPSYVVFSLSCLSLLSLFADNLLHHYIIGTGSTFLNTSFPQISVNKYIYQAEGYASVNRHIPIYSILFGIFIFKFFENSKLSIVIYKNVTESVTINYIIFFIRKIKEFFRLWICKFFQNAWFIDVSVSKVFFIIFCDFINMSTVFEKGIFEFIGPYGISRIFNWISSKVEMLNIPRSVSINLSIIFIVNIFVFIILMVF